ncbi:inositol monophosphatase [Opitutia bacterium ISCC 52]|nr:inositol monophosphatase [Opitutae bacterium ISCC 52]
MKSEGKERLRSLLCELGSAVQSFVIEQRTGLSASELSSVSSVSESDTIYAIDRFSEEALLHWIEEHWPADSPVEVVAEGLEDHAPVIFPKGTQLSDTLYKVIIDPIDGTRELMYDKRSAWVIAGLAPQKFDDNQLSDIEVAMLTELPTTKQSYADQVSGFLGCGREGIVAVRQNLESGANQAVQIRPSAADTVSHGFAALVKFFPEGKELTAQIERELWQALDHYGKDASPVIFDDQYISTGGQMYEMLVGHYRFFGDIRPAVLGSLGLGHSLTCHPYDAAAGLLLTEAGCIYEDPLGGEVQGPLDTVTPIAWVAYANEKLAGNLRPAFKQIYLEHFGK